MKVKDIARVVSSGIPDGEVENAAYMVHASLLREARAHGTPLLRDGVQGYEWAGALSGLIARLWPERSTNRGEDGWASPIYQYLRRTGNAVCLSRSLPPCWWVAAEWQNRAPVVVSVVKPTRAEFSLTPREAGEDRAPAPVEVRMVEQPRRRELPDAFVEGREQMWERRREETRNLILEALTKLTAPVNLTEFSRVAGIATTTLRDHIDEFVEAGLMRVNQVNARRTLIAPGDYDGDWSTAPAKRKKRRRRRSTSQPSRAEAQRPARDETPIPEREAPSAPAPSPSLEQLREEVELLERLRALRQEMGLMP